VPQLQVATRDELDAHVSEGAGSRTLFSECLRYLSMQGSSLRIRDIRDGQAS